MLNPKVLIRFALLTSLLLAVWTTAASAYETYSVGATGTGNCVTCHGDFTANPYTSLADNVSWGDDLHDVHRNTMLGGDCTTCHTTAGGRVPTFLGSSGGGTGLDPISCLGCHGRSEGGTVTGAGLRQHHFINSITTCATAACHPGDSDPGGFTTVGEDVLRPYYFTPDANHASKPTDPCNPAGEEDFAATAIGLDNDGDGTYDQNDSDCQVVVLAPDINLSPATLNPYWLQLVPLSNQSLKKICHIHRPESSFTKIQSTRLYVYVDSLRTCIRQNGTTIRSKLH